MGSKIETNNKSMTCIDECPICGKKATYKKEHVDSPVLECTGCKKSTIIKIPEVRIKINNASFINKNKEDLARYAQNLIEIAQEKCYDVMFSEENVRRRVISLTNHMETKINDTANKG